LIDPLLPACVLVVCTVVLTFCRLLKKRGGGGQDVLGAEDINFLTYCQLKNIKKAEKY
jgi:hypothetical protein